MTKSYIYPDQNDPDIAYKLLKKREFYFHRVPPRPKFTKYEDINQYRQSICGKNDGLHEHQSLLSNMINPNTPYKGMLIFHGLGSGKTCVGIAIAEKFKEQVKKYGTKIHVIVPGPNVKESWFHHIIKCTGDTYLKYEDKTGYVSSNEKSKIEKNALSQAFEYYKFLSFRSFYRKVLGERIIDTREMKDSKMHTSYRKNEDGEFERDMAIDRIHNLNNSVIIIDEAHWLTGNVYGEALRYIIDNSVNLRVILMTATPMKNLADSFVELINFIRPKDSPMKRDKIFDSNKNHLMNFKPNGIQYLKNMTSGYVSHVRGADPLTYARRNDKGVIPKGLKFTSVIKCNMLEFQRQVYDNTIIYTDDALDKKTEAVANFVFPGLTSDRKNITGYYGIEGINTVKNQIKIMGTKLNNILGKEFFNEPNADDIIMLNPEGKIITGRILEMPYLKNFSTKFYKALKKINRLVWGKKGTKTAFIYSNLVRVGIDMFQEVLLRNGYLEYQNESENYQIKNNTVCYFCGKTYAEHKNISGGSRKYSGNDDNDNDNDNDNDDYDDDNYTDTDIDTDIDTDTDTDTDIDDNDTDNKLKLYDIKKNKDVNTDDDENKKKLKIVRIDTLKRSESSSNYDKILETVPVHKFYPATFISVTGGSNEENLDNISDDKKKILDNVFNKMDNKHGKYIKLVLGSKVMNEGISLHNVGEVHILDPYFTLGRIDQVIGRAIRYCSHYKLMSESNPFPSVNVYKYVVAVENGLSTEEELYKKAEIKYMLTKKVERAIKEIAIDCPININGNIFAEETDAHKDCVPFGDGDKLCPMVCDFVKCDYTCDNFKLNAEYYDPTRQLYRELDMNELDYTTFISGFSRSEIDYAKSKIKNMYITGYSFTLDDIIKYVKSTYTGHKKKLFDEFFVFKALDELTPENPNDFNNFKDIIVDKYNNNGYIIFRKDQYIFQPIDQNEDVPMSYRIKYGKKIQNKLSLYSYLLNTIGYEDPLSISESNNKLVLFKDNDIYDFESTLDYYDSRKEFKYVGIIDKEVTRKKNKRVEDITDIFKIRKKRAKILDKKRGTGIPSLKGATCSTSKDKQYLINIAQLLGIQIDKKIGKTRNSICDRIRDRMLELEKYATDKKGDKFTYIIIPANHPIYTFPYNLEDRVQFIINKLKEQIKLNLKITTKFDNNEYVINITSSNNSNMTEFTQLIESMGGTIKDNNINIIVK